VGVAADGEICSTTAAAAAMSRDWSCSSLPGVTQVYVISSTPAGSLWAGTPEGVWALRWKLLACDSGFRPTAVKTGFQGWFHPLAAASGFWVASGVFRVQERPRPCGRWQVVEHLTSWQGFPDTLAGDLIEESNGGTMGGHLGRRRSSSPGGAAFSDSTHLP